MAMCGCCANGPVGNAIPGHRVAQPKDVCEFKTSPSFSGCGVFWPATPSTVSASSCRDNPSTSSNYSEITDGRFALHLRRSTRQPPLLQAHCWHRRISDSSPGSGRPNRLTRCSNNVAAYCETCRAQFGQSHQESLQLKTHVSRKKKKKQFPNWEPQNQHKHKKTKVVLHVLVRTQIKKCTCIRHVAKQSCKTFANLGAVCLTKTWTNTLVFLCHVACLAPSPKRCVV